MHRTNHHPFHNTRHLLIAIFILGLSYSCSLENVRQCPEGSLKDEPGQCGCDKEDIDTDNDTLADCNDECPNNDKKKHKGECGCEEEDIDTDDDTIPDCNDECPNNKTKTQKGLCGCDTADTDSDDDTIPDCADECPDNKDKTQIGDCGCDAADTDSDGDTIPDCNDKCPNDALRTEPHPCGGCNALDQDNDTVPDCEDDCPFDPTVIVAGDCGCDAPDSDNDGTLDCVDDCKNDPYKTNPGKCGCNIPDAVKNVINKGCYEDFDGDNSRFDNSPEGDLDEDNVKNKDDFCPFNPIIKDEKDYITVGNNSCAAYADGKVDIYPGSFINSEFIKKNNIKQIIIHGTIDLNYRTQVKYDNDKGNIEMFAKPESLWGDKKGKTHTPITLPENISIIGNKAKLIYTDDDNNTGEKTRAFLTAPLFANLNKVSISDLLIDIDFYNEKTNTDKNKLHAGLANTITSTTLERVGFAGSVETALDTKGDSYSYGCLVGKVDKDSVLTDVYVDCKQMKTSGDYVGAIAGIVESNHPISVTTANVGTIYTTDNKRSYIGGLFGYVNGSGDITIDQASVGTVSGNIDIGGLIGRYRGSGRFVVNHLTVSNLSGTDFVGGMIGHSLDGKLYIDFAKIENDNISCVQSCGGVVGHLSLDEFSLSKIECHTKTLKGRYNFGGIVGCADFVISSRTTTFDQIFNYVENIQFDENNTAGDSVAGGFIGLLKMRGEDQTNTASLSQILSIVDNFMFKNYNAGLIGRMDRGGDKKRKYTTMNDILSIVKNYNINSGNSTKFAGLISNYTGYMYTTAQNVVSIAVLPPSGHNHALFADADISDRFKANNVYWYQFGEYTNSTAMDSASSANISEINSTNLDNVITALNASASTDATWEVKKDITFDGKPFDIPWLSWKKSED